jgi:tartrate-resistant acid phosphatase type 5
MKRSQPIVYLCFLLLLCTSFKPNTGAPALPSSDNKKVSLQIDNQVLNFFIISDWGWNGFANQVDVANGMVSLAETVEPKFIVSCGDNFQVQGVASVQDPLWMTSYENIYKAPSMQVEWYPVLGNHDYKGNTQAQIDYSKISRRWRMEAHYYSIVKKVNDSVSVRLIFLDTPPLVSEYYTKPGYPDVFKQDSAQQMRWLKDQLTNSKEKWKLVFGHHPVYSASHKHGNTPELISRLKPLLEKYHAQFYICGHDHDLQHLKAKDGKADYIVTGAGGEPRPASSNDMSLYSKSLPGFTLISMHADSLQLYFIDSKGQPVYSMKKACKD